METTLETISPPRANIKWCSWQAQEVSSSPPPRATTTTTNVEKQDERMNPFREIDHYHVPPEIRERLALNPNVYSQLSPVSLQRDVGIAFCCIRSGVRSPSIVQAIMRDHCPVLRRNATAWRTLIDSAVDASIFANADDVITFDAKLMTRAIRNCGPQVFLYLPMQVKQELALPTLEMMDRKNYRANFVSDRQFAQDTEKLLVAIMASNVSNNATAWNLVIDILARHDLYYEVSVDDIWENASPDILDNFTIVKKACVDCSGDHLRFASERLRRDPLLLLEIIQHNQHQENDFLLHIPNDVFVEHPSLIVSFLAHDGNTGTVLDALPAELWHNREILEMYLRKGGQPHDDVSEDAGSDWDYCLAFVEGTSIRRGQPLTSWICEDLRTDQTFLVEAAKRSKWVFRYATIQSFELLLVTAAYHGVEPLRTMQLLSHDRARNMPDDTTIDVIGFAVQIKERLRQRETFFLFMCGIGIDRPDCQLRILNPDIAVCIARFVGVPIGEQLGHLKRALPVAEELCQDPHGREFLAHMGREYYLDENHNVL